MKSTELLDYEQRFQPIAQEGLAPPSQTLAALETARLFSNIRKPVTSPPEMPAPA